MHKPMDADSIRPNQNPWRLVRPRPIKADVTGWDTEVSKDGYAFLGATSTKAGDICWPIDSWDSFEQMAWKHTSDINFFFNLDFDFSVLAKHLGKDALRSLAEAGVVSIGGSTIRWVQGKAFSILKGNKSVKFYELNQYYDRLPLRELAPLVGEAKGDMGASIDLPRYVSDSAYAGQLQDYCATDARICRKLGERTHAAVQTVVSTRSYHSPATIAQKLVLQRLDRQFKLPPKAVLRAAWNSYSGGRFELVRKGLFKHVWQIDIRSAFAAEFAQLGAPDGKWKRVTEPDPGASYGFYKIGTEATKSYFGPLAHRTPTHLLYPVIEKETWVEKAEYWLLRERFGFKGPVLDGYELLGAPLAFGFLKDTYSERCKLAEAGRTPEAGVLKQVLAAAYGKTLQRSRVVDIVDSLESDTSPEDVVREVPQPDGSVRFVVNRGWQAGVMYNPVLGATITSRVRAKLLSTVYDNHLTSNIIGFASDSLYLSEAPPSSLLGTNLGSWRIAEADVEGLFVGIGVHSTRKNGQVKTKISGYRSPIDLFDLLARNEDRLLRNNPIKIREAVKRHVENLVGVFAPSSRSLDPNFDKRRQWERVVERPSQLLESQIDSVPLRLEA